jgi:hypothetical protein
MALTGPGSIDERVETIHQTGADDADVIILMKHYCDTCDCSGRLLSEFRLLAGRFGGDESQFPKGDRECLRGELRKFGHNPGMEELGLSDEFTGALADAILHDNVDELKLAVLPWKFAELNFVLARACKECATDCVRYLLFNDVPVSCHTLHDAIIGGNDEIITRISKRVFDLVDSGSEEEKKWWDAGWK